MISGISLGIYFKVIRGKNFIFFWGVTQTSNIFMALKIIEARLKKYDVIQFLKNVSMKVLLRI